jgi:hypothetical protein
MRGPANARNMFSSWFGNHERLINWIRYLLRALRAMELDTSYHHKLAGHVLDSNLWAFRG